jgi:hypothetical protein
MRIANRLLLTFLAVAGLGPAGTIVLKRAWIEQYKDRATIDATFTIDHAHPKPNAPANDGDMHVAGRAPKEIGLPMVAEIMNAAAASAKSAVDQVHANEGNGQSIAVSGVWRLWFEHPPSAGTQIQFGTVPPAANTNPDHCFEIHPITKVGGNDLIGSFHDIQGFTPKDAQAAFSSYENLSISIQATSSAVTLTSTKSGYNYVLFTMHATSKATPLKDQDPGLAILADVLPKEGEEDAAIAQQVRMIFVAGSAPFNRVKNGFGIGDELTVLGIPRLNLNAVSTFIPAAGTSAVTRKFPYEMIIVALEGPDAATGSTGSAAGKSSRGQR